MVYMCVFTGEFSVAVAAKFPEGKESNLDDVKLALELSFDRSL